MWPRRDRVIRRPGRDMAAGRRGRSTAERGDHVFDRLIGGLLWRAWESSRGMPPSVCRRAGSIRLRHFYSPVRPVCSSCGAGTRPGRTPAARSVAGPNGADPHHRHRGIAAAGLHLRNPAPRHRLTQQLSLRQSSTSDAGIGECGGRGGAVGERPHCRVRGDRVREFLIARQPLLSGQLRPGSAASCRNTAGASGSIPGCRATATHTIPDQVH